MVLIKEVMLGLLHLLPRLPRDRFAQIFDVASLVSGVLQPWQTKPQSPHLPSMPTRRVVISPCA